MSTAGPDPVEAASSVPTTELPPEQDGQVQGRQTHDRQAQDGQVQDRQVQAAAVAGLFRSVLEGLRDIDLGDTPPAAAYTAGGVGIDATK